MTFARPWMVQGQQAGCVTVRRDALGSECWASLTQVRVRSLGEDLRESVVPRARGVRRARDERRRPREGARPSLAAAWPCPAEDAGDAAPRGLLGGRLRRAGMHICDEALDPHSRCFGASSVYEEHVCASLKAHSSKLCCRNPEAATNSEASSKLPWRPGVIIFKSSWLHSENSRVMLLSARRPGTGAGGRRA